MNQNESPSATWEDIVAAQKDVLDVLGRLIDRVSNGPELTDEQYSDLGVHINRIQKRHNEFMEEYRNGKQEDNQTG